MGDFVDIRNFKNNKKLFLFQICLISFFVYPLIYYYFGYFLRIESPDAKFLILAHLMFFSGAYCALITLEHYKDEPIYFKKTISLISTIFILDLLIPPMLKLAREILIFSLSVLR